MLPPKPTRVPSPLPSSTLPSRPSPPTTTTTATAATSSTPRSSALPLLSSLTHHDTETTRLKDGLRGRKKKAKKQSKCCPSNGKAKMSLQTFLCNRGGGGGSEKKSAGHCCPDPVRPRPGTTRSGGGESNPPARLFLLFALETLRSPCHVSP